MQYLLRLIPIFLFVAGTQLTAEEPKLTKAQQAIQGTWEVKKCFVNGKAEVMNNQYTFIRDNVTVIDPNIGTITGKYTVDSAKKPAQIDFIYPATADHGILHWKGLYSIKKDQLVFCLHFDGEQRPKELVEKSQAGLNVIILER